MNRTVSTVISRNINLVIPCIIGIVCFGFVFGFDKLSPSNNAWLMEEDWAQQYLGWEFYRKAPWQFPIGKISTFFSPLGTNICYTDSAPLFSIIFKLFNFLLPMDYFQITGVWFLVCWVLMAYFSNKVLLEIGVKESYYRFLAVLLLTCAPVLLTRIHHATLCAQWLILSAVWNYLRKENIKGILITIFLLSFISAGTHPYLWFIVSGVNVATLLKHYFYTKRINLVFFILFSIGLVVVSFFTFYIIGYFSIDTSNIKADDYGVYSINLNAFFNSMGFSHYLKSLQIHHFEQSDSFAYLGLGFLSLLPFFLLSNKRFCNIINLKGSNLPLLVTAIILFLLALTSKVTLGNILLFEFQNLDIIDRIGGLFRATGRFVWLSYYLMLLTIVVVLFRIAGKFKLLLIATVCIVQFLDVRGLFGRLSSEKQSSQIYSFTGYDTLYHYLENAERLVYYRPFERSLIKYDDYINFSYVAAALNKPVTTGYLARYDFEKAELYKNRLLPDSVRSTLLTNSLYVTNDANVPDFFNALLAGKAYWFEDSGYNYLLSSENVIAKKKLKDGYYVRYDKTTDFLARHMNNLVIIAAKDEASNNLSDSVKSFLKNFDSNISDLQYRGAFVLIIKNGQKLFEKVNNNGDIRISFTENDKLDSFLFVKSLSVYSAGNDFGNSASIIVGDTDYSKSARGFNMVALDANMEVLESINVDTHYSSDWVRYVHN